MDLKALGITSLLTVPLQAREGVLGAIHACSLDDPLPTAADEPSSLASELARRTAAANRDRALRPSANRMLFEASPLPMWVLRGPTRCAFPRRQTDAAHPPTTAWTAPTSFSR